MSYQQTIFANNEYYHVYNRSVGTIDLFTSKRNLNRMLDLIDYYRFDQESRYSKFLKLTVLQRESYLEKIVVNKLPLLELYAFSFNIDHFHILLKQLSDNGIKQFISNIQNGFAKYFNTKNNRHGSVFQNPFKGVRIQTEEQFIHVSRYIHLQPVTSFLIEFENLVKEENNSFVYYAKRNISPKRLFKNENKNAFFLNIKLVMDIFGTLSKYYSFVKNQVDYQRTLGGIKGLLPPQLRKIRSV